MTTVSETHQFLAAESEMAAGIPGLQLSVRLVRGRNPGRPFGGFHDQVELSGGRWGLAVGGAIGVQPAAGGAGLARGAGVARAVLRAMAMTDVAPSVVLAGMNRALLAGSRSERSCLAVAYADVEPAWRGVRVRVCVAGGPAAIVRRGRGRVSAVGQPGYCLGARADAGLTDTQLTLHAGDCLMLVAAGVAEAVGGVDQIPGILARSGGGSAARSTDAVLAAVRAAGGGQVEHEAVVLALKVPLRKRNVGTHAAGWPGRSRYSGG
ncbi:MAG: PP2C family protein-serine/threonine phosphatase [Streptosporangiaceae bacterium]